MEAALSRPGLRGRGLVLSAVLGLALVAAGLGGWFAVLVAAALCWLWRGRPIWLAAVLALALAIAAWATARGPATPRIAPPARLAPESPR